MIKYDNISRVSHLFSLPELIKIPILIYININIVIFIFSGILIGGDMGEIFFFYLKIYLILNLNLLYFFLVFHNPMFNLSFI